MIKVKTLLAMLALAVVATGIGFAVGQSQTEEVRVVARSTTDGRIEFGVEHDGERILPRGRYMNAAQIGARNDKWLRSTVVEIEIADDNQVGQVDSGSEDSICDNLDIDTEAGDFCIEGTGDEKRHFTLSEGIWGGATIATAAYSGCSMWVESVAGTSLEEIRSGSGSMTQPFYINVRSGWQGDIEPGLTQLTPIGCSVWAVAFVAPR